MIEERCVSKSSQHGTKRRGGLCTSLLQETVYSVSIQKHFQIDRTPSLLTAAGYRTWAASNLGIMTQQAPHHIGVMRQLTLPCTWCSGNTCRSTSLLIHDQRSSMPMICACRLPYVCTTPCSHTTATFTENFHSYISTLNRINYTDR